MDPWGIECELISAAAAHTINAIMAVATGLGGQSRDEDDIIPEDFLLPYRDHAAREREKLRQSLAALENMRGI